MKYALNRIPEICFVDRHRRTRILSRRCSLHVSLPSYDTECGGFKPKSTHLHYMKGSNPGPKSEGNTKLEIITTYNRAIIVEFEKQTLRDLGIKQITSWKFSYGPIVLKPVVEIFADLENTRDTTWSLSYSKRDYSYSVHEALRRFFCLQGHVSSRVSIYRSS